MSKAQTHQTVVGINDLWETPKTVLLKKLRELRIKPKIDVFASKKNHKFSIYYTKENSAFEHEITKTFFANPEYSNIYESMKFLYEQHLKHNVTGVVLVFSKPSTKWWQKYVKGRAEVYDHSGRIRFLLNGIEPRYCTNCKTRFIEEIESCKTCKRCNLCKFAILDGKKFCNICDSLLFPHKIGKSSPTYDSSWLVYRKKEIPRGWFN